MCRKEQNVTQGGQSTRNPVNDSLRRTLAFIPTGGTGILSVSMDWNAAGLVRKDTKLSNILTLAHHGMMGRPLATGA